MFVGEQPGDEEDLTGKPFVGPAGKVFDQAMAVAGIDRAEAYVTNAVKHFKFKARGKRRLHQRPNTGEIEHCKWWLAREVEIIRPRLVVAMGATALQALTGDGTGVAVRRRRLATLPGGAKLLATYHPSAILRHPQPQMAEHIKADFLEDMREAKQLLLNNSV
jgi:DNA polymerase